MKKIKVLFILALALTLPLSSCSNDDDNSETNETDLIIGKWKLTERIENGNELTITNCELDDFIEFLSNGTISETYHEPNPSLMNECVEFVDDSGSWNKISDSNYNIVLDEGDLNYNASISFSQNNTIHTQTYTIEDGGENFNYVDKYQKIE